MKIAFHELEQDEALYFQQHLPGHELFSGEPSARIDPATEILSIFLHTKIDAAFIKELPRLKLIATRSTRFGHIDVDAAREAGITVCHVPSYADSSVAEHTFSLMLALSRRLIEAVGAKPGFSYQDLRGFELRGKTLGVIGSGQIGRDVIRIARAFDMKVVAYDPEPQVPLQEILDFRYLTLDELLGTSDIISLHAALLPETYHIINRESLAKCKDGVVLLNTARGALIDIEALIEALDSGKVGGAGLDVLEDESLILRGALDIIGDQIIARLHASSANAELRDQKPARIQELAGLMRNNDLINRPNVVFTPHIAFNSREAVIRINRATVDNIQAFLDGHPINLVPGSFQPGESS